MRTGLVMDPRFRLHAPPGPHPERPERLASIEAALVESGVLEQTIPLPARRATRAELMGAHEAAYLDGLEQQVGGAGKTAEAWGFLDPDTYYSAGTWEATLLAAGAVVDLALAVHEGGLDNGIAFVRPPGHHASRNRAMGFCLVNHVAVAASALAAGGARVAIVDFDVHHGNGTQDIFYADPRVLYCSTHEYPFYPGTGAVAERGVDEGRGATLNVPLPEGAGDHAFIAAYDEVILPGIARFRPDIVIASAGFDADHDDPLASLQVTEAGYAHLVRRLLGASGGRLAMALEGGYHLNALGRCAVVTVEALLGRPVRAAQEHLAGTLRDEDRRALTLARRSLDELPPPAP